MKTFIENPKISYDSKFDVMYYTFGDTSNVYGDDETDGIVVMRDIDSNEVKGYTIMGFKRILESGTELINSLVSIIGLNIFEAMKTKCN